MATPVGGGGQRGHKLLEGARESGDRSLPAGSRGRTPVGGRGTFFIPGRKSGGGSPPEAEAFCLNIYKILSVHGRKFNELDFTHSDSIKSVIYSCLQSYL